MSINVWPDREQQSAVTNRLIELANLDPDDARSACHHHRFVLARMLQAGQSIDYVAGWMARKFGVGLTATEQAIRERVQADVRYDQQRKLSRRAAQ